jgi:15-cis-phytoene synthase
MNEPQQIALAYVPRASRDGVSAIWALDAALGRVVATTTEPMIGQMRLTWWHERLTGLDAGEVPAEPVLAALRDVVRHHDVTGAMLAGLVEGWEVLLDPLPLGDDVLRAHAAKRGDGLFALSARIIGAPVLAGLGAGWALIDFATHCSDQVTAERAWAIAAVLFKKTDVVGPKALRILARTAQAKALGSIAAIRTPVSRWQMLRAVLS